MQTIKSKDLVARALVEYEAALEEFTKPKRDLVMIAACTLIKKSISDFLVAFLVEKGIRKFDHDELLDLQNRCASFHPEFAELQLESIACLGEEKSLAYTNELEDSRLSRYVATLKKTKDLVMDKI